MKVLVVDDDRSARDFAARVLAEAGYEVSSVDSGDAALARLPEGFEIVVTDLDMPGGLNGVQVTQEVRRSTAADVVIMTAFPDMSTAIHAVRAGAYDYLVKPFSPDTLRLAVDRCAQRRRLSKELERERALKEELSRAYNELSQMQRVRDLFGQFMTPEVVKFVTEHPDDFRTRGDRRVVTVMFVDVRGFTPYAARVSPEEAVGTLNQYFELLVGAVQENGGVVNKFLGDGLMAVFGAPQPNPRHALDAVWAAHKARTLLRFLSPEADLQLGFAINTGEVVAGCLGAKDRTEYSVIGSPVNLAARMEKAARPGDILVGPETARLVQNDFFIETLPPSVFAGFTDPIALGSVMGPRNPVQSLTS